jgi:hypothetical protein
MNYKSKYVIIMRGNILYPVVFTDLMGHNEIARSNDEVVGAGFCCINDEGHYTCYGESVSLKVKSRGDEDARVLNKYLGVIYD